MAEEKMDLNFDQGAAGLRNDSFLGRRRGDEPGAGPGAGAGPDKAGRGLNAARRLLKRISKKPITISNYSALRKKDQNKVR